MEQKTSGELYKAVMPKTALNGNGNGKVSKLSEDVTKLTERIEKQNERIEALEKQNFLSKATIQIIARRFKMSPEELDHAIEEEAQRHEGQE